jgi:uncharacterized protein YoxC
MSTSDPKIVEKITRIDTLLPVYLEDIKGVKTELESFHEALKTLEGISQSLSHISTQMDDLDAEVKSMREYTTVKIKEYDSIINMVRGVGMAIGVIWAVGMMAFPYVVSFFSGKPPPK